MESDLKLMVYRNKILKHRLNDPKQNRKIINHWKMKPLEDYHTSLKFKFVLGGSEAKFGNFGSGLICLM